MNPNYAGGDIERVCVPKVKEFYTGLIRLNGSSYSEDEEAFE